MMEWRCATSVWLSAVVFVSLAGCGAAETTETGTKGFAAGGTTGTARTGATGTAGSTPGTLGTDATDGGDGDDGTGTSACPPVAVATPSGADWVDGRLTVLNDNGAWSWFSDERAVVDESRRRLVFSSDTDSAGPGGAARNGHVEVTIYDLDANTLTRSTVGSLISDDHNAGAVAIRPDGNYVTMWAGHNQDCKSYYRTYVDGTWSPQMAFDWHPHGCTLSDAVTVTYANLWNMSSEGKVYGFVRSIGTSPNILISSDQGATWTYGGRLTATRRVGYVAGYYKYWGNGVDRIDFVGTEEHPRNFDNSLYHGYIKGGKTFDSMDNMIDGNLSDGTSPGITAFTKLFATGSVVGPVALDHAWNIDLARYHDGSIALLWQARVVGSDPQNPDLRICYARFDGHTWRLTYLVKGGLKLYASEQDYTGLGALDPDDPHTVYVSTTYDPRDDTTSLTRHEIFRGTTCDEGETWQWTPVTANSTHDNLRPIMPKWDKRRSALLWFRGNYYSMNSFNTEVVGILSERPRR
jgi:hypothetical protein